MRSGIVALVLGAMTIQAEPSKAPLTLARSIELPHVEGRIDHLAFDAAAQRLYVAALGNNTVEVIDARAGMHLQSLPGFREPQGIAIAADTRAVAGIQVCDEQEGESRKEEMAPYFHPH